ncbi:Endonuclease/exonuclease/phosphatase [Parasponia andersonii]|uniref:Endonuclease/exonuclease/phosphatase n=1 Tax=Parasponia andersonii TaxID=3476 RepID=A0A2P5D633_PARAD|nr:Endonuclease/exonuclease/phosphatase [Parasponia andersonii]
MEIYGFLWENPARSSRNSSWEQLRRLKDISSLPWCVAGDFNSIFYIHEKMGGRDFDFNGMRNFRNVASDCLLTNFGYVGEMMIWNNGHEEDMNAERLDRVLYFVEWLGLFPFA